MPSPLAAALNALPRINWPICLAEARGVRILRILTTELSFARDHLIKGNARLI
jgi:hypothetical protein